MSTRTARFHDDVIRMADWLSLAGVHCEVSTSPRSWLEVPLTFENNMPEPALAAKEFTAPFEHTRSEKRLENSIIPFDRPLVTFPEFLNLESYQSYINSYKEIDICKTSNKTILGHGVMAPQLMVIAEAPYDTEDRHGQGFSSQGHQIVKQALDYSGFLSEQCYYTYLSKWRPPGQRALTKLEVHYFLPLLIQEIRLVKPNALLLLGESLGRALLPSSTSSKTPSDTLLFYKNQIDNKEIPVWASQKGESLVKTQSMKKTFWFSLLSFKTTLSARGLLAADAMTSCPAHHNLEYISDVH